MGSIQLVFVAFSNGVYTHVIYIISSDASKIYKIRSFIEDKTKTCTSDHLSLSASCSPASLCSLLDPELSLPLLLRTPFCLPDFFFALSAASLARVRAARVAADSSLFCDDRQQQI